MDKNWLLKSGWLHGLFIALVSYTCGSLCARFVASQTSANLLVYSCTMILSAAIVMIAVAGKGQLSSETLKTPQTWVYAFLQIVTSFFGLIVVKYVSATEGAILYRTGMLFLFGLSILFLNQKTNKKEYLGNFLVFLAIIMTINFSILTSQDKAIVILITIIIAISQAIQKFSAETHKTNRKTNNFKDEVRVTGFIMAVSSTLMLLMLIGLSFLQYNYNVNISNKIPRIYDFFNWYGFIIGVFMGAIVTSISKYCEFYASKTIGSKYLMALLSINILVLFVCERGVSYLGVLEFREYYMKDYIPILLLLTGSALIALSGFKMTKNLAVKGKKYNSLSKYPDMNIEDSVKIYNNKG